ncbi:non-ribosomal peptide synthetase [Paenibacillus apiarius]|uniref:non-ribosomal peptide synthetase n=1 Tax=Paenibacillus apiarius TaxID=46240 RepID=UPI00197D817A|nr:non-ribosomal peptide synthetase [Paenibacillus apiarius]MBN3526500.1 amino acid adenylation domain-containing protein [Paenibacillus apiarius]
MSTKPFIKKVYPLTPMQEGMLYHSLAENNNNTFFIQLSFKAEGILESHLLSQSLRQLIQRHEVFRTVFNYDKAKQPIQVVLEERNNEIYYRDIAHYRKEEQTELLNAFTEQDRNKGFDLTKESLLRLAVFRLGERAYEFIFSFHHIIIDGWCLSTVVKQFFTIYQGLERNRPLVLDEVPPFSAYIKWLEAKDKEQAGLYWRKYIEGIEQQTNLPWTRHSVQQGYVLDKVQFMIPKADTERLTHIARDNRVTLSTLVHAIWGIVLQRYNYSDDVVFGTVVSGRNADVAGIEKMVGLFINTNPVRVTLRHGMKFDELVKELHCSMLESEEHSHYPLSAIQADSQWGRQFINHIVGFENVPLDIDLLGEEDLSGIRIYDFELSDQTNFDFNLVVIPSDELSVSIKFNALAYKRNDMETVAGHIQQLVRAVIDNPTAEIDRLELIAPEEKNQLLHACNERLARNHPFQPVHELIAEQVRKTPNQTAVVYQDKKVTYQELDHVAEKISERLIQWGVKRGEIVALSLSPSIGMIAAILGVCKSGAAFLPIDMNYPDQRIEYLLKDSGASIFICQKEMSDRIDFGGIVMDILDIQPVSMEGMKAGSGERIRNHPDNLAYVVYTSGSTGQPKGVMIEHKALLNLCRWHIDRFEVTASDRATKYAGFGFDASVWEVFPYLACGASLYIIDEELKYDVEKVNHFFEDKGITISFLPTPFCEQFIKLENHSLRLLLTGGDKLKQFTKQTYEIINNYGPSENTVVTTCYTVMEESVNIPIGKPISNTQVYILKHNQLQPIGVAGELCISGESLSKGYLNHEELTREKFVKNPFVPGERMYRTGDLARWLPDGNMEFIGRIDQQVMIRGFRIELGEIENQLLKKAGVKEAVVIDRADESGAKYLCAYVVTEEPLAIQAMKEHLSKELPDYMIPAFFIPIEKMPVTPNGKVDRKALPEPDRTTLEAIVYEAPRNEIEANMAFVWQNILGVQHIGINDNFFQLGGDSIKAIQVSSHLKKHSIHIEIKDLFNHPSIKRLSNCAKNVFNTKAFQGLVEGETPLTPIQRWFFEHQLTDIHHWNQSVMLVNKKRFDVQALRQAIDKMLEHHDALRMVYSIQNGRVIQTNRGWIPDLFELDVFDFINDTNIEAKIEAAAQTIQTGMDLASGPLVKAGLFQTRGGDHVLLAIHHLVIDGVSWRILLEDLAMAYEQVVSGEMVKLPRKTSSYKKWAECLKEYANSEDLLQEHEYWSKLGESQWRRLPKEKAAASNRVKDAQNVKLKLPACATERLLRQTNRAYNTEINDILLTALGTALTQWLGSGRILIGVEGHGREGIFKDLDVNRTVGWFTSLYPVMLSLPLTDDMGRQIMAVKKTLRAIPNKGIGYGVIQYLTAQNNKECLKSELNPEITFNYLGQFDPVHDLFSFSNLSSGQMLSPEAERAHAIDITGVVINGELQLSFLYNGLELHEETIVKLSRDFKRNLLRIIEHCVREIPAGEASIDKEQQQEIPQSVYPPALSDPERRNEPFPLTDIQMAYWLGRNKEFDIGGVSTHAYTEVETAIDMRRFNDSLNKVIRRHPMLRAIFLPNGEQHVLDDVPDYTIEITDIRHLGEKLREECIEAGRRRMSHHVFQTNQWPLFEFTAYQTEDDQYLLCISRDLLIADAASMDIMGQDLMKYYENPDAELPELEFTFRDYVLAYKQLKTSNTYEADKEYWQQQLEHFPSAPQLPVKKLAAEVAQPQFKRVEKTYSMEDWKQLKSISFQHGVTPATLFLTIYARILSLWSNQPELAINLTVYNRYPFHKDTDKIIGDFTSNLLLGVSLHASHSFWDQAKEVQRGLLDALEHRHYEGVEFIRDIARHKGVDYGKAIMPIVFTAVLNDNPANAEPGFEQLGNLKTGISQTSQVYIDFQATILSDELWLFWDYVDQLFDAEVVQEMFAQFTVVVDAILTAGKPIDPQIAESDEALIEAFNQTDEEIAYTTLHGMFAKQVKRVPDGIAVICGDASMTYRELNERSNQIAHYLQEQGVGRNDFVGVRAERQVGTIVNILGILKAGAAYVPIDPEYPEDRISYMAENSSCKMVMDPGWYESWHTASCPTADPEDIHQPQDVAYVVYTSGSTGRPKGVVISHGAAANTIQDINNKHAVDETDRIIGLSSMCFDLSVYDIFGALGAGAALVMVQDQREVAGLWATVEKEGITIWNSVPAIMEMLADNIGKDSIHCKMKAVLLSGDWIPLHLAGKVRRHFPHAQIISLGGATEASIWSIYYPIGELAEGMSSIPYGMPLANQQIYVLNYELKHCPVGVQGELYIGGIGLAEGYLNDGEKTRSAFIMHPELGRIYRTGDYGILHRAGYIEFLGRKDQQVKIRGYRVELGEIERRLVEHDFVGSAVVVDCRDPRGKTALCAYYVSGDEELTAEELRIYLLRELPEYMVPAYFIELPELPLTANGKVDRKSLPEPDAEAGGRSLYEAPRNETETKLAGIWEEALGVERVGIHDNFFELGGNSIQMVQIRTRIGKELGSDVSLRDFLQNNTIARLGERIAAGSQAQTVKYPELVPDPARMYEPFPLTDVQMAYLIGREDHFELGGVSTHAYLELETHLDMGRFNEALLKVIDRHSMLRTIVLPTGQQRVLEHVPNYRIEIADISHLDAMAQEQCIARERERMSHYVFPSDQWPLFEYKAYKLSEGLHYLFIGYDMLITDGASFQLIHKEVMSYYNQPDRLLPELPVTFRDYMMSYTDFQNSESYAKDKQYWLNKLEDFPEAPALLYATKPENIIKPHFYRKTNHLNEDVYKKLKKKAREYNVTPSAVLCTAFAKVLSYWSNQERIALNCTVFNRFPFHEDVYSLIGDFTSVMLLDIQISPEASFWGNAETVQDVMMEALEHRHYDGVKFIRDIARYNNLSGNKAIMPIVFTSMLLDANADSQEEQHQMGEVKMALSQTSQVIIDYQVLEADGGLTITWDYVKELFDPGVIEVMFTEYFTMLDQVLGTESAYVMSGRDEDRALAGEYNDTDEDIRVTTLHTLFAEQAKRMSNEIAVISEEGQITYGELNKRSNQIAHFLNEQGIGRHDCVGVLAYRHIETIVNIMGILKAGAAYVPIDPEYPEDRRAYMLDNSNSKLLADTDLYVKEKVEFCSTENSNTDDHPEDVAYVIYTSGSTGRPKGVVITHGAAANTIRDMNNKFAVGKGDRILNLSSMCFDLSVYDIFGALSSGAALVMIKDQRDLAAIGKIVEDKGITIWNSVPAIMDLLLDHILGEHVEEEHLYYWSAAHMQTNDTTIRVKNSTLRLVLLSGDWIPLKLPNRISNYFMNANVISLGGATEASIWSVYYPIHEQELEREMASVPYGMPLANQKLYVLNYELKLCPIGVEGELYIGGAGLAKEYLNDKAKTQKAFIVHPEYGRLYRTGDCGVLHSGGYIEFTGRKDQQVKISGYRVELGEIEHQLLHQEGIKEAVVVDKKDSKNKKFLCAYLATDQPINTESLKKELAKVLPSYMIPSYYMRIDKVPLTPNGKVNRKALPDPDESVIPFTEYAAPNPGLEQMFVDVWHEILDVEKIGVTDNLFDLGVDSTSIIKFVAKTTEHNVKISIQQIFLTPTIRQTVQAISDKDSATADFSNERIRLSPIHHSDKNIFCFPPIVALGVVYQRLSEIIDNYAFYSFNFIESDNRIQAYIQLIKEIQPRGPYTFLGISAGGNLAFELTKELEKQGDRVADLILMDSFFIQEAGQERSNEEESRRYAYETVDYMLEQYPQLQSEGEYFRNHIGHKIQSYYVYLDELINSGRIAANISVIKSPSSKSKHVHGDIHRWKHCTTARFASYAGYGDHEKMLDHGFVEENAVLIQKILNDNALLL